MSRSESKSGRSLVLGVAPPVLILTIVLAWLWWPQKVELSGESYDVAIALYRVCNQQDSEGLQRIEEELDQLSQSAPGDDESITHLRTIVGEAQAGEWQQAMRSARQVLADQTDPI